MKSHRLIFLLILLSVLPCALKAQFNSRLLSLEDAIEIAKQQSPDAFNSKQEFRISFWEFRHFRALYLPALRLDANIPNFTRQYTSYLGKNGQRTYVFEQYISAKANLALEQKIGVTGGTISLNSELTAEKNLPLTDTNQFVSIPVYIKFDQPLFQFNPYRWDRKIEPLKYDLAKRKFLEDVENIAIYTTNYFFNLLQAQLDQKIALTNLSNYDTLYHIAKGRYQLGKIAENDLLQLELSYLRAQANVETASLDLESALFQFKSYLRIKDTVDIELIPPIDIRFFKIDPVLAIQESNRNTSTALDFKKRLLEAARDVNKAKRDDRFDANISAEIGLTKNGPYLNDVYTNPDDLERFSLQLTIPILDWGVSRGEIKKAQSQEEIVKNSVEQEIIDYQRNIYLKAVQFNMQQNQILIAAKSDTVARKSYEVTKGRYLIGKPVTILELNNAQIETDASRKSYFSTLQTFWSSYYEIRKLTLFDFRNNVPLSFDIKDIKL